MASCLTRLRGACCTTGLAVWGLLTLVLTLPILLPAAWYARRRGGRPWVIGGHRGRLRADNAGALHEYLLTRTGQPTIWVASTSELHHELRRRGLAVVRRGSLAARWAILSAPVLVYSHGEDDLDLFAILLRRCLGLRVYVGHCMRYIKASEANSRRFSASRGLARRLRCWRFADFDLALASAPREARNYRLSFPWHADRIRLGGGAHLDEVLAARGQPPQRTIVWFPTYRETSQARKRLTQVVREVLADERLREWLAREQFELLVGAHVNTGQTRCAPPTGARLLSPGEVPEHMRRCALFVSDYSGTIFDWLALDRPLILFPFDSEDYLRRRKLLLDYDELDCGPVVQTAQDLVETIVSGGWRDLSPWAQQRARWQRELFPTLQPEYAQASYEAIRAALEAHPASLPAAADVRRRAA
jgi:hypothetical protein